MFIQSLSRVIFPLRLHHFAQQAWLPLLREDLASPVSSLTSTISFLMLGADSHYPARPVSLTGSCVIWRNHFAFRVVSAPGCISGQLGASRGQLRALARAGRDPGVQNMLCSCYKKALWDLKSASVRNFPLRQKLTQLCKKVLNVHGKMMLFQEARQWLHFLNLQSFSSNK